MRAELFERPEDYLVHFENVLKDEGLFRSSKKITNFYADLKKQFQEIYYNCELNLFVKWGSLLAVDAKLHILLELVYFIKLDKSLEVQMSEEDIIQIVLRDYKTYYRELTQIGNCDLPKRGLIYLSEDIS